MTKIIAYVIRHGVDVLTATCTILAILLLLQPGSWVRTRWNAYRANVTMAKAARGHWPELVKASAPLFAQPGQVQVVEIADYECPFCRRSNPAVDSAVKAGVRIAYLNFPLPIHAYAKGAAMAALCAGESGHFLDMHSRLLTTAAWQKDSNWTREALQAGVSDTTRFNECMRAARTASHVTNEFALGETLGVRGTPTFVTPGGVHQGVISTSQLMELAEE